MGIKFGKDPLAAEQNHYWTKILNVYFVYELYDWSKIPTNNLKFKKWLFGVTNIVKNNDKEKHVYSGYGITFNSTDWWKFANGTARNVTIFGVDNSSSSHVDKCKNNFLISGLGLTFRINGSFGSLKKIFIINFAKASTNFCLSLHDNVDNSYLFVNGKEITKFKADNRNVNFSTQYCLGSISNGFSADESREVSSNGNVYDFSVDYNSLDKLNILNIHKYLMTKNDIK